MRISITTHANAVNHGAFLQAYSLMKAVQQHTQNVEMISHSDDSGWVQFRQTFTKHPLRFLHNLVKLYTFKVFQTSTFRFTREPGEIDIWGSDVVFQDQVVLKKDRRYSKLTTYACSCGSRSQHFAESEVDVLKSFNSLSIRDAETLKLLEHSALNPHKLTINLDPIFLYDFSDEIQHVPVPPTSYVLAYGYDYSQFDIAKILINNEICGANILNIGYYNRLFGRNKFATTPFELPAFIKGADFLITTTFHGVMFAIKYNVPFMVLGNDHIKNKTIWLLEVLDIRDRYVDADSPALANVNRPLDDRRRAILNDLTLQSEEYLSQEIITLGKYNNGA